MKTEEILKLISVKGLIDLKKLSDEKIYKDFPKVFDHLLAQSYENFEKILKIEDKKRNFENTVNAYLKQDLQLGLLFQIVHHINSTIGSKGEVLRKIIDKYEPLVVEYSNKVSLSPEYFKALQSLDKKRFNTEEKRAYELLERDLKKSGVGLPKDKRKKLESINKKIAALKTKFQNNVTDDRKTFRYEIDDENCLKELPKANLELAKGQAKKFKSKSKYVFTLSQPDLTAILKYCLDRKIRKYFLEANDSVASRGKFANKKIVLEILKLRDEKSKILGYKNYVEFKLDGRVAKTKSEINKLQNEIFEKARKKSKIEIDILQKFSGLKNIERYDTAYFSNKYKEAKFGFDEKEVSEYFSVERVLDGMFLLAKKLFGLDFKKINNKTYSDDVSTYEVYKGKELRAYYFVDFFAGPNKRGGAWCDGLRNRSEGVVPIVFNVSNFTKGKTIKETFLNFREVETAFHEFGHALHLILSRSSISSLSGFRVEWDFVEIPSQLLENWCEEKEFLDLFAKHKDTGKNIPNEILSKMSESNKFGTGIFWPRQIELGAMDLEIHSVKPPKNILELDELINKLVAKYSTMPKAKSYCMYTAFLHLFSGGYASGYYSYLWSDVMQADIYSKFQKNGCLDSKTGKLLEEKILGPGAMKDGADLFRDFMGRSPDTKNFYKKYGL